MHKSLRDPFFAVETCFGCKKALNKVANARVIWMHLFYVPPEIVYIQPPLWRIGVATLHKGMP